MIVLLLTLLSGLGMNSDTTLFDFSSSKTAGVWYKVNDVVMGGISQSALRLNDNGSATFSGNLSAENNGGFASVRAAVEEISEGFAGVIIKAKGDGKVYNLRFRTSENFDGPAYQAKFKPDINEWQEFRIPFTGFSPTFRGRYVPNQAELVSENIRQIGILISDKQFGAFTLDIKWIKFYKKDRTGG